jgi:short-subunit dehydrogenase involved in D-alanine esterification of teichoic acids
MTTATTISTKQREPTLLGQTVVLIGGSGGIGLETARRARAEGAEVILTGRDPERLEHAAQELGVLSRASFDAADPDHLARFFRTCRRRSTTNTAITGATYDIDGGQQLV